MKTLYEVLVKQNIKNNNDKNLIDCSFKSFDEFARSLNDYFNSFCKLEKPIKVVKTEVCFNNIGPYSKDGIYVGDHFDIWFSKTQKIRVGSRKEGILFQYVYKDYKGKWAYDWMLKYYKLNTNFLNWLIEQSKKDTMLKSTWERYLKKFNIEVEK